VNFKEPHMALEFQDQLHPRLRDAVDSLASWSRDHGLPDVMVTEVIRTERDQERIYTAHADRLIYRMKINDGLSPDEEALALKLVNFDRDDIMAWARARFSWHCVGCAVDLRSKHYSGPQKSAVAAFLKTRCTGPEWEFLEHDVSGPHFHLALRDQKRREVFTNT
jgi:hypothetical protein